jgi:hypothetical protein
MKVRVLYLPFGFSAQNLRRNWLSKSKGRKVSVFLFFRVMNIPQNLTSFCLFVQKNKIDAAPIQQKKNTTKCVS